MNLTDHQDAGPVLTGLARGAISSALGLPANLPSADWLNADGASFVGSPSAQLAIRLPDFAKRT